MKSLNIVAHPDDDLLFLNPDILGDKEAHIVYLTMGDDGKDRAYIEMRRRAMHFTWSDYPNVHLYFMPFPSNCHRMGDKEGFLYRAWHEQDAVHAIYRWQVTETIRTLLRATKPDIIRTHNPYREPILDQSDTHLDHIDHIYTGKFVVLTCQGEDIPILLYEGYVVRYFPPNLDANATESKRKLWRLYQSIDKEVANPYWDVALDKCYKVELYGHPSNYR